MKKTLLISFSLLLFLASTCQVRPDQFQEKTTPTGTDEIYSQSGGSTPVRISFENARKYFGGIIVATQVGYIPTPQGNTQNLNSFVRGSDGNVYFISQAGSSIQLNSTDNFLSNVSSDGSLSGSGTLGSVLSIANSGVTTNKIANNAVTFAKMQTTFPNVLFGSDGSGNPLPINTGTGIDLSNGALTINVLTSAPISGNGTNGNSLTIQDGALAITKIAPSSPNVLIGYDGSGNPSEIDIGTGITLSNGAISASGNFILREEYDIGNGVKIRATDNGGNFTSTLSNGVITIVVPSGEILLGGNIDIGSASATYSNQVSANSIKIVVDNSANNKVSSFNFQAYKKTSSSNVSTSNPLTNDFNLNADKVIQDFSGGLYSTVFQSIGTRASSGAIIVF